MTNKVYSFLSLATKAGKVLSGEDTCERAVKSGKVDLILIAGDASDNTKKKFSDICKFNGIEIRYFGEKQLIGKFTGKELRSVVAVTDSGFAGNLVELIDRHNMESGGE